ncbi:MAG: acetylxylan esterase [Verrucomicrobiota bacterium]
MIPLNLRPTVPWLLGLACLTPFILCAEAPRVLSPGEHIQDHRLAPPKDLDGYFPFVPAATPEAWKERADQVRLQMQVALGLWPSPTKTPLNPVVHGRIERGDYTVEKVYFESVPGFFVTGNLYRPKDTPGRMPGVLCPHGHWEDGRFMDYGPERVRREIVQGAERFEEGGRSVLQSRCVQLARMGCVVFHYDMIGYADSAQISFELAHGFAKQRPAMNDPEKWGFFSPQAEAHLQSVMGLQTWDSIRALDFLLGLPDVDPARIAVTGASGGGTQTFVLCALDSRPAVAFPAVMVSTAMQGGCTCENASLLRVDTGNVEFAALFAPKPLGMTAANDWTREMPVKGFPELKRHFAMMGAPEVVMLKPLLHFDHNYNYVSRAAMYAWLNRHLHLGLPEPIVEADYQRLNRDQMSVWDQEHPRPPAGPDFERQLTHWLASDSDRQIQEARSSLDSYQRLVGAGVRTVLGRDLAHTGEVAWELKREVTQEDYVQSAGLLRNVTHAEEIPAVILQPKVANGRVVIWTESAGKAGLFTDPNASAVTLAKPEIRRLLDAGLTVVGLDLLWQGEHSPNGERLERTPRVKNPREAAAYTFGYNRAVFAERTHDLLTAVKYLQGRTAPAKSIDLIGLDATGPIVVAARSQAGTAVRRTIVNTGGFRFGKVAEIHEASFLPGGAKYGDVPAMLALAAPGELWISGESQLPDVTREIYQKAGAAARVRIGSTSGGDSARAALTWLLADN